MARGSAQPSGYIASVGLGSAEAIAGRTTSDARHASAGVSLFLIAVGAILAFAINVSVSGIDLYMVGIILLTVGVVGTLMSALFWTSLAPFGRHDEDINIR
jgi:hypothetical protein